MKKLLASLPMIWLILGAVVIATEINKPMLIDSKDIVPVPVCQTSDLSVNIHSSVVLPVLCAE